MYVVTACGCTLCEQANFTIYGYAASVNDVPLMYGDIYWNGSLITNTSSDGTFSFSVELGSTKASILFIDSFNRTFMNTNYVFKLPADTSQSSSQYIRVNMLPRAPMQNVDASNEAVVTASNLDLNIPANSFYTADGQPFTVTACLKNIHILYDCIRSDR